MINSYIFNGVKASAILFNRRGKSKETLIVDTQRTPIFGLLNGVKDRKETRPFLLCLGFPKQKLNRLIRGLTDCIIVKINTQEEVILIVKSLKKLFPRASIEILDLPKLNKLIREHYLYE